MTIFTQPIRKVDSLLLEDFTASTADYLGAVAGEAFTRNPLPSLSRSLELDREERQGAAVDSFFAPQVESKPRRISRMLTADEANAKFGPVGLKFDEPVRESVAEILAERKKAEVARQSIIRRAQPGVAGIAAGLAIELLVTASDPLNVASAFIPVVREARFAQLTGRFGVTGARLIRGGVEGAVGAAVVEPLVLGVARREQADYDLVDSLMNVAFGTVLGGGLHAGGGKIADILSARSARRGRGPGTAGGRGTGGPPTGGDRTLSDRIGEAELETQEAALKATVAELEEGRSVSSAEQILEAERSALARVYDEVLVDPLGPLDNPRALITNEEFTRIIVERGPAFERDGKIEVRRRGQTGHGIVKVIFRHGEETGPDGRGATTKAEEFQVTREDVLELPRIVKDFEPSDVRRDPKTGELVSATYRLALPNEKFGNRTVVVGFSKFTATDGETRLVTMFVQEPGRTGHDAPLSNRKTGASESPARPFKGTDRDTAGGLTDRLAQSRNAPVPDNIRNSGEDFNKSARRVADDAANPENIDVADSAASERASARLKEAGPEMTEDADAVLGEAMDEIDELAKSLGLDEAEVKATLENEDADIRNAEDAKKALRASAQCKLRGGG